MFKEVKRSELLSLGEYYEELIDCDNSRFVGWFENNSCKCILIISPIFKSIDTSYLLNVTEYIADVCYEYKNENHAQKLLKIFSEKYIDIPLMYHDNLHYSLFSDYYSYKEISNIFNKDEIIHDQNVSFYWSIHSNKNLYSEFNEFHNLASCYTIETMEFKILSKEELKGFVYDSSNYEWSIPLTTKGGNYKFMGFHYFKSNDFSSFSAPKNLRFLVCIVNSDKLAGVMKLGDYSLNSETIYVGLNYIDVHKGFRRKGIAKGMYNFLNEVMPSDTLFISSSLSNMGKEANLDILRKSIVTNFNTYDNTEEYYKEMYCQSV